MKVTLTAVNRKDRVSKAGKPYVSLGIKTQEHADKWLSGFEGKQTKNWKVGDTVEIEVEQKGKYLNFSVPKLPEGYSFQNEDMVFIKTVLGRIVGKLEGIEENLGMKPKVDNYPVMDSTNDGEQPF